MQIAGFSIDQVLVLPISIIAFLLLLTVIVFIHEYGHFSVARLLGVRVDVFSI
ncbi:MAG: site-2 protease family protein, partial [Pseudomonadota bacterium]